MSGRLVITQASELSESLVSPPDEMSPNVHDSVLLFVTSAFDEWLVQCTRYIVMRVVSLDIIIVLGSMSEHDVVNGLVGFARNQLDLRLSRTESVDTQDKVMCAVV